MDMIEYGQIYESGPLASVDWVAGGNFDGYIFMKQLQFNEQEHTVMMKIVILDQSKYDGEKQDNELHGRFEWTDHGTITCTFGDYQLRGKVVGAAQEYLAFSTIHPDSKYLMTECYKRKT